MSTPAYDLLLTAYQRAFGRELSQIVESLPLAKNMHVLDVPCGNGFYSRLLASRLGRSGKLVCADKCTTYLSRVRRRLQHARCKWDTQEADAYSLPFADAAFDFVWCAQSLISLDDPVAALKEMMRVVRVGGHIAILENDIFHHVMLSWPVDLELPVQRAIQQASKKRFGDSDKLAPARWTRHVLEQAGLRVISKRTFAADRQMPWPRSVQRFLELHVKDLRDLIHGKLSRHTRTEFDRFVDHRQRHSLFRDPAMDLTCLNALYVAKK